MEQRAMFPHTQPLVVNAMERQVLDAELRVLNEQIKVLREQAHTKHHELYKSLK
jgi:hypothetical protein